MSIRFKTLKNQREHENLFHGRELVVEDPTGVERGCRLGGNPELGEEWGVGEGKCSLLKEALILRGK